MVRIGGQGMPNLRGGGRAATCWCRSLVETPRNLTKRQEELLRELAEIDQKNVSPERKSFLEKVKEFFTPDAAEVAACGLASAATRSKPRPSGERVCPTEETRQCPQQPNRRRRGRTAAATAVLEDLDALRAGPSRPSSDRDEFRDLAQRTRADFENYQKRIQRDLAQERRYAHGPLAVDLLPALDNLDRAIAAAKQAGETGPLVQGVAMVQAQLLDLLAPPRHHAASTPRASRSTPTCTRRSCSSPPTACRPERCCRCWSRAT